MKKPEPTLKSVVIIAAVIMCMWVAAGGAVALMTYRGVQDVREISQFIDRQIVDHWDIDVTQAEYTVGEGPGILLYGDFVCSKEVSDEAALLQFRFEVRPVNSDGPIVRPQPGVPRDATMLCNSEEITSGHTPFLADWHTLEALNDLDHPTEYQILYSVESGTGWVGKQVETSTFVVNPAN